MHIPPRIDAHLHLWRYRPDEYAWIDDRMASLRRDFLPVDAQRALDAAGMHRCVAVQARQSEEETRWLLDLADANPVVAGVVGWVDLQADDLRRTLERWAAHPRLVGVRHVVQDEPDDDFLLRPAFNRGIAMLADFDLAYDILIYPRHLPVAVAFAERHPGTRFVLDHLAKPDVRTGGIGTWARDLRRMAALPHVWAKLSGLVTEAQWDAWTPAHIHPYLDVAFECFGPERLMIGSDWPVCLVAAEYPRVVGIVTDYMAGRPAAERNAVMGENAARFWKLPPQTATR